MIVRYLLQRVIPLASGVLALAIYVGAFIPLKGRCGEARFIEGYVGHLPQSVTFNKEIAPIIYEHCAPCHRPGQSGPFVLLDYSDLKKRLQTIDDRVSDRAMPPWLPEPGHGEFQGDRRLTVEQIGLIQQWVAEGAAEGNPADLPPKPVWPSGWQLGQPDLVLQAPEPFQLPADGRDVYHILVIPSSTTNNHYVRAMEFHPGNRAIHHAFILIDQTPVSKLNAAKTTGKRFDGMDLPVSAATPEGHSLSWQPGRVGYESPEGMAWTLPKGASLVVQLHMNPTGKPESIQPEIGLFFTAEPPTKALFKFPLESKDMDIPPGVSSYLVTNSYRIPVDVNVLGVNPHAHYLGKEMYGFAILPSGKREDLLLIKNWDFAWQGDYRLKQPLFLPKGSTVNMRYTYDNSTNNARNPNSPPKRVQYGMQTTDEMAELWIQVTASRPQLSILAENFKPIMLKNNMATYRYRLRVDPNDAAAFSQLGFCQLLAGATNEAVLNLRAAIKADPSLDEPHYYLGLILRLQRQLGAARQEFERTVELNPNSYKAYGNLGLLALESGKFEEAEQHFRAALAINPEDPVSRRTLKELQDSRPRQEKKAN